MAETQTQTVKTYSVPRSRKTLKKEGRKKRTLKLRTDKEFAKTYFEARSKRSEAKKTAFRKRHSAKKA
jgi:hypothetical protein